MQIGLKSFTKIHFKNSFMCYIAFRAIHVGKFIYLQKFRFVHLQFYIFLTLFIQRYAKKHFCEFNLKLFTKFNHLSAISFLTFRTFFYIFLQYHFPLAHLGFKE